MVELGLKASQLDVWDRKQHIFSLEVTKSLEAYTKYPFLLEIPQNKTEEVLEERLESLGLYVHRPLKAVGMKGDVDELGNTEVSFESGEVVKAQYVIGADGARSVVSSIPNSWLLIINFISVDSTGQWYQLRRSGWSSCRRLYSPDCLGGCRVLRRQGVSSQTKCPGMRTR